MSFVIGSVYFAECGMRNFDHVYFAEILMQNVPQIIRCSNSAFRNPHSAKYCFTICKAKRDRHKQNLM